MLASETVQQFIDTAIHAIRNGDGWASILDELPVPTYTTDSAGRVTYWNAACVEFAGREPERGEDRWCVTWQLYTTDGDPLPHDECPMARAIKEKRAVRGEVAIALRPDGSRRAFIPYPTPYFDSDGNLEGAVNLLIDVTEEQAGALSEQAARCRRLAKATTDRRASQILASMAKGYATTAGALSSGH